MTEAAEGGSRIRAGSGTVAVFDFDGTLLAGDTLLILHRLLKGRLARVIDGGRLAPGLLAWRCGALSTVRLKEQALRCVLTGTPPTARRRVLECSLPEALIARLRPEALERLRWHQRQGHRVVIVTASPRALVAPVADQLQVDLIATETSNPLAHGPASPLRITSANCKGDEKVRRLRAWLGAAKRPRITLEVYGDSEGDRPLLAFSDRAHWRSFRQATVAAPQASGWTRLAQAWIPLLALLLLSFGVSSLAGLGEEGRRALAAALGRLVQWIPALYGVLAVAYLGRYLRWRLLLGSEGIGGWNRADALAWFRGFALTATPGKLGELSRVQTLHQELGYPRTPLVHVFVAEQLCDLSAVVLWLTLLAPAVLHTRLSQSAEDAGPGAGLALAAGVVLVPVLATLGWRRWGPQLRRHLPSGPLARACWPAAVVSLGIWGSEALILWLLVLVISPGTPVSVPAAITIFLVSGTAGLLSSLPGGVGVNEGTTALLLAQAGVAPDLGLAIAVLRRFCTVWTVTALAVALSAWQRKAQPG